MRIVRKDSASGKTHHYIDLDADGERIPGVTTLKDRGLPQKQLQSWHGDATADFAIDHWDELTQLLPATRLARLKRGRYENPDKAKNRGTAVHKYGERLLNEEAVSPPPDLVPYVESYARLMDVFQLRATYIEALVYSETHRYCGTFDLIADVLFPDDPRFEDLPRDGDGFVRDCLIDAKTNRSGVYGETALQLAAYRYAEYVQPDPYDPDTAMPMPDINWTGAIWVRPDAPSQLLPVVADDDQFRMFLYVREVGDWDQSSRDLVGEPVEPASLSRWVLVKAEEDQP